MRRTFFPEQISGYELSPLHGWFSILEPAQMTNHVSNPSFEDDDLTLYSEYPAMAGTIEITSEKQRRGAYSLKMTPSGAALAEGVTYGEMEYVTEDIAYTISFDIWGTAGHSFDAYIETSAPAIAERISFKTKGRWERKYITFNKTSGLPTARTLYILRTSPVGNTAPFYIDGLLLSEGIEKSTYFDGDTMPYGKENNYVWLGARHASKSVRSSSELSTGIIKNLNDYSYSVLAFLGLGLGAQNHTIFENALLGGGTYQRGKDKMREYSIVGALSKDSLANLLREKSRIEELLRNSHTLQQPLTVRVEMKDDCGEPLSQPLHLRSLYMGGFEGIIDNLYQERSSLQFKMDHPRLLEDGEEGKTINGRTEFSADFVFRRMVGTGWDDWDTGVNVAAYDIKYNKNDGKVYVCGNMTQAGSVPITVYNAARWDPQDEEWEAMPLTAVGPSGGANSIFSVNFTSNGDIWLGGEFVNYGGVAGKDYLVYYEDGVGWTKYVVALPCIDISVSQNGYDVYVLCHDPAGAATAYVYWIDHSIGAINLIGTVTNSGADTFVWGSCVDKNGDLYVGGQFDDIDGTPIDSFAVYDPLLGTWSVVGGGLSESVATLYVNDVILGGDDNIYLMGVFDDAGGVTVENIAKWNRQAYSALGSGLIAPSTISKFSWNNGLLYVPVDTLDITIDVSHGIWNGSNWIYMDINLDSPYIFEFDPLGNIYIAGDNVAFQTSGYSIVTNSGTANAEPVFVIKGELVTPGAHTFPDLLCWIKNETTDQTLYLDIGIDRDEVIVIDMRRGRKRITSSTRGDITYLVLPSSIFSDFNIVPGDNYITMFIDNAANDFDALVSYVYWQIPHDYMGGAVI